MKPRFSDFSYSLLFTTVWPVVHGDKILHLQAQRIPKTNNRGNCYMVRTALQSRTAPGTDHAQHRRELSWDWAMGAKLR